MWTHPEGTSPLSLLPPETRFTTLVTGAIPRPQEMGYMAEKEKLNPVESGI